VLEAELDLAKEEIATEVGTDRVPAEAAGQGGGNTEAAGAGGGAGGGEGVGEGGGLGLVLTGHSMGGTTYY
jgi:hypothetical protein